jgi:hypothetical protein
MLYLICILILFSHCLSSHIIFIEEVMGLYRTETEINALKDGFVVSLMHVRRSAYHYDFELYVLGPLSEVGSGWDLNTG